MTQFTIKKDIDGHMNLTINANKIDGKPCPICEEEKRKYVSDVAETIYFALTNWDVNVMTKGFARELAKQVVVDIRKDVIREILGEIVRNGSANKSSILQSLNKKYGEMTGINIPKKW